MKAIDTSRYTITESGNVIRSICGGERMLSTEVAQEAWREWVKDKPFQSEDTAKGFMEGFNFCLMGKVEVAVKKTVTKILTAQRFKSRNPFTKYMQKNIEERYLIYHEDWEKLEAVKQRLIKEGFKVRVWNVIEEEENESN